jgi:hypothetical protein
MAVRQAFLYEHHDLPGFWESLRSGFMRVGLGLLPPGSGAVTMLDDEGEPVQVPEEAFERRVRSNAELSFQWWFAECEGIHARILVRQSIRIIELGMEGCRQDQLRAIGSALMNRVAELAEHTVGLVFDPVGTTEDYDWARFFLDEEPLDCRASLADFPEALVVSARDLDRLSGLPEFLFFTRHRGLVAFARNASELEAVFGPGFDYVRSNERGDTFLPEGTAAKAQ